MGLMMRAGIAELVSTRGSEHPADRLDLVRMIRQGLDYDAVENAAAAAGIDLNELAGYGAIPLRTLSHSRRQGRFSPIQSDRVMRFLRVWSLACDVFGTVDKARAWMGRSTLQLDGRRPAELLDTDEGARLVEELLGRIEHGIAA